MFCWNISIRKKMLKILEVLEIFKNLKIRYSNFVALLMLHHIIFKTIDPSFKTAPMGAIPVNPYFWSKSTEHDVTLTSLTADIL